MKLSNVKNKSLSFADFAINGYSEKPGSGKSFARELAQVEREGVSLDGSSPSKPMLGEIYSPNAVHSQKTTITPDRAAKAYSQSMSLGEQLRIYADEQLLSNPGGDHYDENSPDGIYKGNQSSFATRVGKDFSDALANMRNFFLDLTTGSFFKYKNEEGKIETGQKPGLLSSIGNLFKHLISGITFGAYLPDGNPRPSGFKDRLAHFFKSLYKAIIGEGIGGIVKSINSMAEDLALAVWNAAEIVPDATVGNIPEGRKAVTALFDGGQVMLDYLTDVAPGGEAWDRVHSANILAGEIPFLANLEHPQNSSQQPRYPVKNTPFRKAIETLGTLAVDILGFFLLKRWLVNSGDSGDRR